MNTDYSQIVKDQRDSYDYNSLLSDPQLTIEEEKLGNGEQYFRILYLLFISNGMILAHKRNYATNWKFTLGTLLISYPLAFYTSKYVFGYEKLRKIHQLQKDTFASAKFYETAINQKL